MHAGVCVCVCVVTNCMKIQHVYLLQLLLNLEETILLHAQAECISIKKKGEQDSQVGAYGFRVGSSTPIT